MPPTHEQKPRNLLIVTTDSVIAGTERMILAYLERHDGTRYRPCLVTVTGPGDLAAAVEEMGVTAHHLNARSVFSAAGKLRATIARVRPAIVHSYLFHTNILTRFLRFFCPIPRLVCGMRSVYFPGAYPGWYHRVDGLTHRLCDRFIANSIAGRDSLIHMAGVPANKIDVIPNGIDVSRFECDRVSARERLIAEFSLPRDVCLFGILAQLRPRKHHDLLFRALQAAGRQEPRLHLLVVGEGSERERLLALKGELNLDSQVTMTGYREDIPEILAGLDGFVLPTSLEGSPVSLMEAMATGLPIIACPAGGVEELVTDRLTGLLVEPGDEGALTRALLTLARDATLRGKLGTAARERIRADFSLEVMAKRIENVYDNLPAD